MKLNEERFYAEINLKFDSENKTGKQKQVVKGDEETISALIGDLIKNLLESGFDRKMLEYAIEQGLNKSKKEEKKIEVKEIHITKENAKEFAETLKKIIEGGNVIMENGKVEMKLDDFMDLLSEKESSDKASDELDEILTILFDNARLNYNDTELYFDVDSILNGYLKGRERCRYNAVLKKLQEEKAEHKEENK